MVLAMALDGDVQRREGVGVGLEIRFVRAWSLHSDQRIEICHVFNFVYAMLEIQQTLSRPTLFASVPCFNVTDGQIVYL